MSDKALFDVVRDILRMDTHNKALLTLHVHPQDYHLVYAYLETDPAAGNWRCALVVSRCRATRLPATSTAVAFASARRSASVTAVAWRTSAGAAARVPVARATNLNRTLKDWADAGLQVIGLDADGDTTLDEFDGSGPVVVVVGSEGKGLSRLVRQNCDTVVSIPMAGPAESLNAAVAAGVVLAEIARQRRR